MISHPYPPIGPEKLILPSAMAYTEVPAGRKKSSAAWYLRADSGPLLLSQKFVKNGEASGLKSLRGNLKRSLSSLANASAPDRSAKAFGRQDSVDFAQPETSKIKRTEQVSKRGLNIPPAFSAELQAGTIGFFEKLVVAN
jgi:hypothetical protein